MSRRRSLTPTSPSTGRLGLLAGAAGLVVTLGLAAPAQATGQATPMTGQTLNVSPSGTDTWSRPAAARHPLATKQRAVQLARPGDRIVVSGGTYAEAVGWGAVPASKNAPITLTAAPGQRVVLEGTLQMDGADYWFVNGINVTRNPASGRKEFLVKFDGGTGWRFTNAEVWGSQGVSNIMISATGRHGSPADYRITGNCVHDNNATGDPFMNDHQIYLMPGYSAGRGVISRNIFYNTRNGAAIKAAGGTSATGASNVSIENNTVVRSAAGVIIGFGSNRVSVQRNLIGAQLKVPPAGAQWVANYRAAVVGNHLTGAGNSMRGNAFWRYPSALWTSKDSTRDIAHSSITRAEPAFNSTSSCSGFRPKNRIGRSFGRYAS